MIILSIWEYAIVLMVFAFSGATIALIARSVGKGEKNEDLGSKRD